MGQTHNTSNKASINHKRPFYFLKKIFEENRKHPLYFLKRIFKSFIAKKFKCSDGESEYNNKLLMGYFYIKFKEEIEDNYKAKSPIQLVPFEGTSKEDNVEVLLDSRYSTQTYEFSLDDLNKAYNELINNRSRILDN
ncbi:hypothetical protein RhiirC2_718115 [Rhizophagus irregularis]|uniref:Uncharacterized protein n=1 Tax=Rhizophagus irregularis TaxID=588596 RepID=A0A2N1MJR0_9GLOM|nr:hypothetical protein RhiirC2_718115 [Rhizophagus irregularis]